jgi:hypothetical protein
MTSSSMTVLLAALTLLLLAAVFPAIEAYITQQQQQQQQCIHSSRPSSSLSFSTSSSSSTSTHLADERQQEFQFRRSSLHHDSTLFKKRKRPCPCPQDNVAAADDEENDKADILEGRREALFAMMGTLWAATTIATTPFPALATAGVDAKMAFPDILGGMNDRNTKQCLVESLGNRECLVYREENPEKLLYQGADAQVLLQRIQTAANALQSIPPLVETKQWSKITGILTGPMGQLSATLTMLVKVADNANNNNNANQAQAQAQAQQKLQKLSNQVKQDVFAMGTATTQRQAADILKYQQLAVQDLAVFLQSL